MKELDASLDLWGCMWRPEEQECFETAVVRTLIGAHPPRTRLLALATCHVIATPRLQAAAGRVAESGVFTPRQVAWVEERMTERFRLHEAASRLRGNLAAVEHLLTNAVAGGLDPFHDQLLDWIDLRDLVAVARTTLDARLFSEIERRIGQRGKYQRGRAANVLGFRVPQLKVSRGETGQRVSQSPESGEFPI